MPHSFASRRAGGGGPPGGTSQVDALLSKDDAVLESLTRRGLCSPEHPAVSVELYGSLRIRSGQSRIELRADTIRTAMEVMLRVHPALAKRLPPVHQLTENHRFSINGHVITTDLDTPLKEGDHLILFSASVGG